MIDAIFLVAWAGVLCFVGLICLGIWKAFRIWLEGRSFEDQAKQIHNQSAQYLSQDLKRLTPEQFMKHYRGRLR